MPRASPSDSRARTTRWARCSRRCPSPSRRNCWRSSPHQPPSRGATMLNSETLEVAIGMAFLFLSVALICTAAKEWLEGIFRWRAMDLERGLRTLLADSDGKLTEQLMQHP